MIRSANAFVLSFMSVCGMAPAYQAPSSALFLPPSALPLSRPLQPLQPPLAHVLADPDLRELEVLGGLACQCERPGAVAGLLDDDSRGVLAHGHACEGLGDRSEERRVGEEGRS